MSTASTRVESSSNSNAESTKQRKEDKVANQTNKTDKTTNRKGPGLDNLDSAKRNKNSKAQQVTLSGSANGNYSSDNKGTTAKAAVNNRRTVDITTPVPKQSPSNNRKYRAFAFLMTDVVYVMSGYQNPRRGQLRDKMTAMGAKYKPDWDKKTCTHLM